MRYVVADFETASRLRLDRASTPRQVPAAPRCPFLGRSGTAGV